MVTGHRLPRASKRVARAEGEGDISESENLILGQIRNYFDLPFSRHFHKFDENELANRILWMIANSDDFPSHLNIFRFTDPVYLDPERPGPVPREDIDNFLVAVGNYIQDMKQDDFDWQVARRRAELARQRRDFSKDEPKPTKEGVVPALKKKVRRLVQRRGGT